MKGYLPYIAGALLGAFVAYVLSSLLVLEGTVLLIVFGTLPALGGALIERFSERRSQGS